MICKLCGLDGQFYPENHSTCKTCILKRRNLRDKTPEGRAKAAARHRKMLRLHPEKIKQYNSTPKARILIRSMAIRQKLAAFKIVKPMGKFCCAICGYDNLIGLVIDHVDESGPEKGLYAKILKDHSKAVNKQILCCTYNWLLRVLGHNYGDMVKEYLEAYNSAIRRAIKRGDIIGDEIEPLNWPDLLPLYRNQGVALAQRDAQRIQEQGR